MPCQKTVCCWVAIVAKPLIAGGATPWSISPLLWLALLAYAPFALLVFCREMCECEWSYWVRVTPRQLPRVVRTNQLSGELQTKVLDGFEFRRRRVLFVENVAIGYSYILYKSENVHVEFSELCSHPVVASCLISIVYSSHQLVIGSDHYWASHWSS